MGKLIGLLFIVLLVVSCSGKRIDNTQTVSTPLGIKIINTEIYTDSEKKDALKVIDLYWTKVSDCVIKNNPDREDYILAINPQIITVKIRKSQISETGREFFPCFAGRCSALSEGRRVDTVPSLPALGMELGHYFDRLLFGHTDHDADELSIICSITRICNEYAVNKSLLGCK